MTSDLSPKGMKEISLPEEANLIETAWRDPATFTRLYLAHVRPVYRYIFSKVGDITVTEDLTAQVFLEALEGLPGYRYDGQFAAWLFGIARHKVSDHYRSQHRELTTEDVNVEPTNKGDILSTLILTEDVQHMSALIQNLDEQDRELLRLRFIAQLNFGEIAQLTHSNTEKTKKKIYRLLGRLRQQMELNHDRL